MLVRRRKILVTARVQEPTNLGNILKKNSMNLSEALSQTGHTHFYSLTENQPTATKYLKPAPNL